MRAAPPAWPGRSAASEAATAATPPADLVEVGRVLDAYGLKGWVKVEPFNAAEQSVLRSARTWWLDSVQPLRIAAVRLHGDTLIAHPVGFDEREAACTLRARRIAVSRGEFPGTGSDEYYWVDLIGCEVVGEGGVHLGTVAAVDDHGAHPILDVRGEHAERVVDREQRESGEPRRAGAPPARAPARHLIPFVDAFVRSVDIPGRRIVVDWGPDY